MTGSGRKLSRVSAQEMETANSTMVKLHAQYCASGEDKNKMDSVTLQKLCEDLSLLDAKLQSKDVSLIFESVKVGKGGLNADRFQVRFVDIV